ncbi:DNA polymerase III subunit delta [Tranquillimonas alkanivorans]|uniref:DNA-directed DNA polymerase n=1 Tax=Tranquillimonas alkanivorans TaxID=441119 RepID=A0A1I5W8Y0_9RHOB|nr:DNA polymerase III subunit delta [Tranquillimonas alkanivorans]SFQ15716.1 DNA polymerase III, delta subunit [Tranquillimonas alkanivorans]
MKLNARDAAAYFRKPDPQGTGALIYGQDAMRVALKRQELIANLVGPKGEEEMRLARLPAADLRRDPAALIDAVTSQGFFPGPRVAFVEDATDGLHDTIATALQEWRPGDAQIVVTAGQLNARSKLRKLFEGHRSAVAVALYDDPPGRDEIEAMLSQAGLKDVGRDAMADLTALARALGPGDFRQTLDKIALYKMGDDTPLTPQDIATQAPTSTEAAVDDLLNVVAEARAQEIGPLMQRIEAQGVNPTTLCINALRHFRQLHQAASDPGGAGSGIARVRPPVFGPRRDRMVRQAQAWGAAKLEQGLGVLIDTDLTLRSTARVPQMALVERALIRLAMLGRT